MKQIFIYILGSWIMVFSANHTALGQEKTSRPSWKSNFSGNFYFVSDDFLILPVYKGDMGWSHLEMRYNYEERNAFSVWYGYNFSGGGKFKYTITPMVGGIFGSLKGVAPGLELDFNYYGFELSSESEYVFGLDSKEDNFYYNWTDFSYSPLDWMWFGLSVQRTRLYETELDLQRGLLIGGGFKGISLNGYLYNLGWDDPYFILSLSLDF
jgi:hypothetical protein